MDATRFDRLVRSLTAPAPRRRALAVLLAGLGAAFLPGPAADARKRRKRKKRCRPKCAGKVCGPNGCRGTCGPGCALDAFCRNGQCVACLSSTDCPDDPTACTTFVCSAAGACIVTPVANGTGCGGDNRCRDGACVEPPVCAGRNDFCEVNGQCCSNDCDPDPIFLCRASPAGGACRTDFDCASGDCVAFVCA
jgi:hypothetical protein